MRCRITKTGNQVHIHRDPIAQILIESGLLEVVVEPPPSTPQFSFKPNAKWKVEQTRSGYPVIVATCDGCGLREEFHTLGNPAWRWNHCGGAGCDAIPAEIKREFKEMEQARA